MTTGWKFINGKWYYLNPTPAATTWKQDESGNWVYDPTTSQYRPLGSMYADEVTPDGYTVDKSGAWVESIPKK